MRLVDADALMEEFRGENGADALDHFPLRFIKVKQIVNDSPTIDAIPVEATAKRLQRAFFSDNWEAWAEWLRGNYSDEDFVAHVDGKKDAIPVEWLNERHRKCCEEGDTDLMDAITVLCNEYHVWQKEQEAR